MKNTIEFTRINNDVNGNPRYVIHFLEIPLTKDEQLNGVLPKYELALKKARTIGGKKYHTKSFGGGIVFQCYNLQYLEKSILNLK